MDENVSYDYIWQAYQKEKQTNQLLLVPKSFYEDALEFINNPGSTDPSIKENAARLIADFFEKRKQKILIYIAYNKQLPQPISNNESEFYNKVLNTVKSERINIMQNRAAAHALKSIKDIPEIILPSGNRIGPLKKDQIIDRLPEQDRTYLIDNTICEQI